MANSDSAVPPTSCHESQLIGLLDRVHISLPPLLLSGVWLCDDGGAYAFHQEGDALHFEGWSLDGGRSWSNVFDGVINGDAIEGKYFDRPPGLSRNSSALKLVINGNDKIRRDLSVPTPFYGQNWMRVAEFPHPRSLVHEGNVDYPWQRPPTAALAFDISGRWNCTAGGAYDVTHQGNRVIWTGVSTDHRWSHSFSGVLYGNVLVGEFSEHDPSPNREAGPLFVRVIAANRMEKLAGTGLNLGAAVWTR